MKKKNASDFPFSVSLIGLALALSIMLGRPCFAAAPGEVLIINTELPGKSNSDPTRIDLALHKAGASRTRILSWTLLSADFLKKNNPSAVVLSGQGTPWTDYDPKKLENLCGVLRSIRVPVLGICGGHQLLAIAFGGKVAPIQRLRPGVGYAGDFRERGWKPVTNQAQDALFSTSSPQTTVWLNHCDEVKVLPAGFARTMSDSRGANQAMESRSRRMYGVQFHPEVSDHDHPFGPQFLHRFLALTGS